MDEIEIIETDNGNWVANINNQMLAMKWLFMLSPRHRYRTWIWAKMRYSYDDNEWKRYYK